MKSEISILIAEKTMENLSPEEKISLIEKSSRDILMINTQYKKEYIISSIKRKRLGDEQKRNNKNSI